jgi:hypothetical protein
MKIGVIMLFILFFIFSCKNDEILVSNEFTVIVESTADFTCYLPVIRFLDNEDEVKKRTGMETLTYNAYHLDSSLNVVGNTLTIDFTQVTDEDIRVCNTFGIPIPGIVIISERLTE